jgi:hypothetical protein
MIHRMPPRALTLRLVLPIALGVGALAAGCSTGGNGTSYGGASTQAYQDAVAASNNAAHAAADAQSTTVASGTQPSNPDEPMTVFEKRRLVARLQQDPHALQRLSPRERREVAAMVAAANRNKDDDRRN